MAEQAIKKYKRGEFLYKEGDVLENVFFIQSGRVSLNMLRSNQRAEIMQLSVSELAGEQAVMGNGKQNHNAEALSEVSVLEIPLDTLQKSIHKSQSMVKVYLKGVSDINKKLFHDARAHALETDNSPCPQPFIARIFCILNLVCRHLGKFSEEEGVTRIDWTSLKLYTTRMLLGSPVRMERALEILTKLKYVELEYDRDEEDEDVEILSRVIVKDLRVIEDFGEFYQYQYYKGGKSEIIELDPIAIHIAACLVGQTKEIEADRRGLITLNYQQLLEVSKAEYGLDIRDTHWGALERKGLFVKRFTNDEGTHVSFEKEEFRRVYSFWQIISEIDKWNSTGEVDINEDLDYKKGIPLGLKCGECKSEMLAEDRFCSQCGNQAAA